MHPLRCILLWACVIKTEQVCRRVQQLESSKLKKTAASLLIWHANGDLSNFFPVLSHILLSAYKQHTLLTYMFSLLLFIFMSGNKCRCFFCGTFSKRTCVSASTWYILYMTNQMFSASFLDRTFKGFTVNTYSLYLCVYCRLLFSYYHICNMDKHGIYTVYTICNISLINEWNTLLFDPWILLTDMKANRQWGSLHLFVWWCTVSVWSSVCIQMSSNVLTWISPAAGLRRFSKCFCRCCSWTFKAKPEPKIPFERERVLHFILCYN